MTNSLRTDDDYNWIIAKSREDATLLIKKLREQCVSKARIVYGFSNFAQFSSELTSVTKFQALSDYYVYELPSEGEQQTKTKTPAINVYNGCLCRLCFEAGNVVLISNCELHTTTTKRKPESITNIENKQKCSKLTDVNQRLCECGSANPSFGLPSNRKKRWCKQCPTKPPEAVNVKNKRCECNKSYPCFGMPTDRRVQWCKQCPNKPSDAINIKAKRCECGRAVPCFGLTSEMQRRWCKQCPTKPAEAVNVKDKRCECNKYIACFALESDRKLRWCKECPEKPSHAINIKCKQKSCECGKAAPYFGLSTDLKARWCSQCPTKLALAVDIKHKRCECGKAVPSFGLKIEKKARWCKECPNKPGEAIGIYHKRCECGKAVGHFGLESDLIVQWCQKCPNKPANAINLCCKRCECGKAIPYFGLITDNVALWCAHCPNKPTLAIDVKSRKCGCGRLRPTFGFPGKCQTHCRNCKEKMMIEFPSRKCQNCNDFAIYGVSTHERCEQHKKDGDINFVEQRCSSCGLLEVLDKNGHCKLCDPQAFKEFKIKKEAEVVDFLRAQNLILINNKVPNGTACGKERPDVVIDCKTHVIIIEIDEFQHKSYQCECEQVRMVNITQTFGGLPCFWIRYNPDKFNCGPATKTKRLGKLMDVIGDVKNRNMTNLGEVLYLFFDNCDAQTFQSPIFVLPSN